MDYRPYISRLVDPQNAVYVSTMGCASFSLIHECNIDLNLRAKACQIPVAAMNFLASSGIWQGGQAFLSTRYEVVMSGTQTNGNTDVNTNTAIDDDGAAAEGAYTFDMTARQPVAALTYADYFTRPDQVVVDQAKQLLNFFEVSHFPINTDHASIVAALAKHPVRIFVGISKGWSTQQLVTDTGAEMNHAVLVVALDADGNFIIQDTFAPYEKTLDRGFKIYAAFQTYLTPKGQKAMYKKVVHLDGKTFGVMVQSPNGATVFDATTEDIWRSWSQPNSYQINTVNADGTTNWSTADCIQLPW
jgi:hypothetical protein